MCHTLTHLLNEPVVLGSQGQVRTERLGDVLVEVGGKRQRGVQVEDEAAVRRGIVHEEDVVILQPKAGYKHKPTQIKAHCRLSFGLRY